MKLYYMPGACSMTAHIVLEWTGAPYQAQRMAHAELKTPEFLALNPAGAVPALEDGGWVLTQNVAILNYLAELHPQARLAGDGSARGRAEVNRWLGFVNADLHPAFKPLFGATAFLGDAAIIEQTKAQARKTVRALFERADRQLQGREWLTGSRSIADAYLYVVAGWTGMVGIDISDLAGLQGLIKRMNADPAVAKVRADEGLA